MAPPQRRSAGLGKAATREHPVAPPSPQAPAATEAAAVRPDPPRPAVTRPAPAPPAGAMATLSGRVPAELRDRAKIYAVTHGISLQDLITEAIEDRLNK